MWNIPSQERLNSIPCLYQTESTPLQDKMVYLHFFMGSSDWYVCEFDGDDLFFGYVILNDDLINAEWGYFSFSELKDISVNGLEVDCELEDFWHPKPVSEISKIMQGRGMTLKPICKLVGEDGYVFNLIGIVRQTLRQHHLYRELDELDNDLQLIQESGGTYDDVLVLFTDYVEVVLT